MAEKETNCRGVLEKSSLGIMAAFLGIEKLISGRPGDEMVVYKYNHPTDDCLCPGHVAISLEPDGEKFYGVPHQAVKWN